MASSTVTLDRDGLDRLYAIVSDFTEEQTERVADIMRRLVPVDTGELQTSIQSITVGTQGVISVGTDYWTYQEFGTSRMAAQPFIRPALYRSA